MQSLLAQAGASQQNLSYTYDRAGNLAQSVDSLAGETMNYTYDALNRLTGVAGALSESYSYDPATGNLASKAGVSYNYAAQVSCPGGVRTIAHAVSGQQVRAKHPTVEP